MRTSVAAQRRLAAWQPMLPLSLRLPLHRDQADSGMSQAIELWCPRSASHPWRCHPLQVPPECARDKNFDLSMFTGRWYITAGLNPLFDTFPCQEHFFGNPEPGDCSCSQEGGTALDPEKVQAERWLDGVERQLPCGLRLSPL